MRITLEIPDGIICAFFNGVKHEGYSMSLVSYQLGSEDLFDGVVVKLPREEADGNGNG